MDIKSEAESLMRICYKSYRVLENSCIFLSSIIPHYLFHLIFDTVMNFWFPNLLQHTLFHLLSDVGLFIQKVSGIKEKYLVYKEVAFSRTSKNHVGNLCISLCAPYRVEPVSFFLLLLHSSFAIILYTSFSVLFRPSGRLKKQNGKGDVMKVRFRPDERSRRYEILA